FGWRPLRWADLPRLLGKDVPDLQVPADWPHWVIDLDDLDPSVPAGVVPARWHRQTVEFIRKEMREARVAAKAAAAGEFDAIKKLPTVREFLGKELDKAEVVARLDEEDVKTLEAAAGDPELFAFLMQLR